MTASQETVARGQWSVIGPEAYTQKQESRLWRLNGQNVPLFTAEGTRIEVTGRNTKPSSKTCQVLFYVGESRPR